MTMFFYILLSICLHIKYKVCNFATEIKKNKYKLIIITQT